MLRFLLYILLTFLFLTACDSVNRQSDTKKAYVGILPFTKKDLAIKRSNFPDEVAYTIPTELYDGFKLLLQPFVLALENSEYEDSVLVSSNNFGFIRFTEFPDTVLIEEYSHNNTIEELILSSKISSDGNYGHFFFITDVGSGTIKNWVFDPMGVLTYIDYILIDNEVFLGKTTVTLNPDGSGDLVSANFEASWTKNQSSGTWTNNNDNSMGSW